MNLVAPGWIPVERHTGADTSHYLAEVPLGRIGTPEDIAGAVAYLTGDAASFVTAQRITAQRRARPLTAASDQGMGRPTGPPRLIG